MKGFFHRYYRTFQPPRGEDRGAKLPGFLCEECVGVVDLGEDHILRPVLFCDELFLG